MLRSFCAIAVVGTLGWEPAALALAEAPRFAGSLDVEHDPTGCIAEVSLRARVEHWLKPGSVLPEVAVTVHVEHDLLAFSMRRAGKLVALRGFEIARSPCRDRRDAIALAIALAIEHEQTSHAQSAARSVAPADLRAQSSTPNPGAPAEVPAAELAGELADPTIADPAAQPRPQDDSSTRVHAHVGYQWMAQALPEPTAAIALGIDLGLSRRFSLVLSVLAAPDTEFGLGQGRTHVEFAAGRALACASWLMPARLGVSSCAGGMAGKISAAGVGYAVSNRQSSAPWVAGLAGGSMYYPDAGPIALRLSVRGVINAVRPVMWVRSGQGESTAHGSLVGVESSIELLIQLT
jgi:hypothetical protein